jgi:Uma2 family endonuclease
MATTVSALDRTMVLENVSWRTYEQLLADLADSSAPRMTYDRGVLELMSPTHEHERLNRMLAQLVEVIAEELEVEIENLGSSTFRREDLERGFEPDSCFYIRNVESVRGKRRLDLTKDSPPDLVIEIDITSHSINKIPIYAQMGVPEVWRYDGKLFRIDLLEGKAYVSSDSSRAFPILKVEVVSDFLERSRTSSRLSLLKSLRAWIRERRREG